MQELHQEFKVDHVQRAYVTKPPNLTLTGFVNRLRSHRHDLVSKSIADEDGPPIGAIALFNNLAQSIARHNHGLCSSDKRSFRKPELRPDPLRLVKCEMIVHAVIHYCHGLPSRQAGPELRVRN